MNEFLQVTPPIIVFMIAIGIGLGFAAVLCLALSAGEQDRSDMLEEAMINKDGEASHA